MEAAYQDTLIPWFGWLIFGIILVTFVGLVARTIRVFIKKEFRSDETLGLPKGTIRSFIIITFTGIMFIIFFGDIEGAQIPDEDRKWFLTAYASVLSFYFGSKFIPSRSDARGLAIMGVDPPVSHLPAANAAAVKEMIVISGSGFDAPKSVEIKGESGALVITDIEYESLTSIKLNVTLAPDSKIGAYDVVVALANGSIIVGTSKYSLESAA